MNAVHAVMTKVWGQIIVLKRGLAIIVTLTEQQRGMLSTPQYQIRKEKKAGLLVSPSKVTVVGVVDPDQDSGDVQHDAPDPSGSGPQETFQISHQSAEDFVSRKDLDVLSNQLEEKFARFEALLSRGNIFSTPKIPVSAVSAPTSNQPFFDPSDPRATGPVRPPGPDVDQVEKKNKGPGKKTKKTKAVSASSSLPPVTDDLQTGDSFFNQPSVASKVDTPGPGSLVSPRKDKSSDSSGLPASDAAQVGSSGATGHGSGPVNETAVGDSDSESVTGRSVKDSEEGEISDTETVE